MTHKKRETYIIKRVSILLCIPFILTIVIVSMSTVRNNIAREHFAEQLYNYTLPEHTTIEEKTSVKWSVNG